MRSVQFARLEPGSDAWCAEAARQSTSLVLGFFSNRGDLRYANAGLRRLAQLEQRRFDPAFFRSPKFSTFAAAPPSRVAIHQGLLTVDDGSAAGCSIMGAVFRQEDAVHIVAEVDAGELAATLEQMHALHHEVSQLHREAARQQQQIKRALSDLKSSQAESERLSQELIRASRNAGRAEVAASVLHNMGNAINTVHVASGVLHERLGAMKMAGLTPMVDLLVSHESDLPAFFDSPRGAKVVPYLKRLRDDVAHSHDAAVEELTNMRDRLNHVATLVTEQRSYGNTTTVRQEVELANLVQQSCTELNRANPSGGARVSLGALPPCRVTTDPLRLGELLAGLARAGVKLQDTSNNLESVVLSVAAGPPVHVQLWVPGVELSSDAIADLLQQKGGPRGRLDLHALANTATELDARLVVTSNHGGVMFVVQLAAAFDRTSPTLEEQPR